MYGSHVADPNYFLVGGSRGRGRALAGPRGTDHEYVAWIGTRRNVPACECVVFRVFNRFCHLACSDFGFWPAFGGCACARRHRFSALLYVLKSCIGELCTRTPSHPAAYMLFSGLWTAFSWSPLSRFNRFSLPSFGLSAMSVLSFCSENDLDVTDAFLDCSCFQVRGAL